MGVPGEGRGEMRDQRFAKPTIPNRERDLRAWPIPTFHLGFLDGTPGETNTNPRHTAAADVSSTSGADPVARSATGSARYPGS